MIDHSTSPSVFDSFNARNLSPKQVAKTFIPPEGIFDDLVLRSHSLIIGPRGSGKTTLLKMLQPSALTEWNHPEAHVYKSKIDFIGVFVPTDISWGAQLDSIGTNTLPKDIRQKLGLAAFTTHVLISFVESLKECTHFDRGPSNLFAKKIVFIDKETEANFVKSLASNWRITITIPSLDNLKLSLRDRISEIAIFANQEANTGSELVNERFRQKSEFHIDFIDAIVYAIDAYEIATNTSDTKWALLFDELEIAPTYIRRRLFRALRSTDQRILFKLSISPYSQDLETLESSTSAMSMQDFKTIELWYPRKENSFKFAESLLQSMIKEIGGYECSAEEIFGNSIFDIENSEEDKSVYQNDSKVVQTFKALAQRDESFKSYLKKYALNLERLNELDEIKRASTIRKINSIVSVREAFRGESSNIRSRKNPDIYSGAKSIFAIAEGNPRWFIGLVGPLLKQYFDTKKTIDPALQSTAITSATNKFRSLLKTIPFDQQGSFGNTKGLLTLLDKIGESFFKRLVLDPFTPEPPLSFIVDVNSSPEILHALGRALNAGAIIYVPDETSDTILSSLKGKRFRLSYMLAPHYRLPLTLGASRSLSSLIANTSKDLFNNHE